MRLGWLALLVLVATAGLTAGAQGREASRAVAPLEPPLAVDTASTSTATGTAVLTRGAHYLLTVSGQTRITNAQGLGFDEDALYCFDSFGFDAPQCTPPNTNAESLYVRVGSGEFLSIDQFGGRIPPYSFGHTYTVDFYAPATGKLEAGGSDAATGCKSSPSPCQRTWSGTFTITIAAANPTGGGGGSGGAGGARSTAKAPFGTPVAVPAPAGKPVDASSPKLPAGTKEVELDGEVSDAEIDRFILSLTMAQRAALRAYLQQQIQRERERYLENVAFLCMIFSPGTNLPVTYDGGGYSPPPVTVKEPCVVALSRGAPREQRRLAAAGGCSVRFAALWTRGFTPTVAQRRRAAALAGSLVHAGCTRSGPRFSLRLSAVGNVTLDKLLGGGVPTDVERTPGGTAGPNPRVTLAWQPPVVAAPAATALGGHYAGTTTDGKTIAFDVASGGSAVTHFQGDAQVTCADGSSGHFTFSFGGTTPLTAGLAFSHSYSGPLTVSGGTISNLVAAYAVTGKLDGAGNAAGTFRVGRVSFDQQGKHLDCTGNSTTWTARRA